MAKAKYSITAKELSALSKEPDFYKEYFIVDIRDSVSFSYRCILGAINIPEEQLENRYKEIPEDKIVIVYCEQGNASKDAAEFLRSKEYEVMELHGGYTSWLVYVMETENDSNK